MNKEFWTGKKLVIKIVAGVVTVALVGTGIGVGVVRLKIIQLRIQKLQQ